MSEKCKDSRAKDKLHRNEVIYHTTKLFSGNDIVVQSKHDVCADTFILVPLHVADDEVYLNKNVFEVTSDLAVVDYFNSNPWPLLCSTDSEPPSTGTADDKVANARAAMREMERKSIIL